MLGTNANVNVNLSLVRAPTLWVCNSKSLEFSLQMYQYIYSMSHKTEVLLFLPSRPE